MRASPSRKLNILQQSPYDIRPPKVETGDPESQQARWIPSRYNVRATATDGRLVVWNSFKGTMSVFGADQRPMIESLLSKKGFEGRAEGVVKYLRDRGFLLKEGADEYRQIQLGFGYQQYRDDTLQLILLASEDCNFRCAYCYEEFARGTMQPWVRTGVKRLVERRLDRLRNLSISWFGGEPLYGMAAIDDLAPFFFSVAEQNKLSYSCSMTTNGYLLTPEVAERLLAWNVRRFQITIDGPPESHDCSRPTRDGQGTFSVILDNLKALSEREDEFMVAIRVNFDRNNYPQLDGFLDLIEDEFRHDTRFKLMFRAVGKWGGPNDSNLDVCGRDETASIQADLKKKAQQKGIALVDDIREVKGMGAQVCYAARPYNFIIGASGKLMKCTIELDSNDRNVVGSITEDGSLQLDQDKLALWTEPAFERDTKCQKCVVLPTCQGVFCPLVRMNEGRSPCTPLRMSLKSELRGMLEVAKNTGRRVMVQRAGVASSSHHRTFS